MEKEIKIAIVIKTMGLEYDDRVRKEILTIEKLFPNISFKIFAMLPDNKTWEGVTEYGVPFKSVYIPARDKYSSAKKVYLKAYQFYKAVKKDLDAFDIVWAANIDASFVPMLYNSKRIVWDLHELPTPYLSNGIKKWILKYIFRRCKIVIHANPQRLNYLESIEVIDDKSKHYSIRNYPNFEDVDKEFDETYIKFVEWRANRKCVYLQGLNNSGRAAYESVVAILQMSDLVAVVVGGYDNEAKSRLVYEYGTETLSKRILFVGKIAQLKIPQYMRECYMSLVFYKNIRPNNYYCEANRFYQAVMMGLPVVVGSNPPMKEIVDQYGFGISIADDGGNIEKIKDGITIIINNYDKYKTNVTSNSKILSWDSQESYIINMINKILY
jgi:hypothetical protein